MNFTQHSMFIGAVKSAVGAATGVILANVVDVQNPIFSLAWLKHIGVAIFFVVLVSEARYLSAWANSGTEVPLPAAIGQAKELAQKTEDAIAKVQAIAPEAAKPEKT